MPVLELSLLMSRLSPRAVDIISAPLMNLLIGDLSRLGLRKMPYGPMEEIRRDGNVPVLDIGTIQHIRKGHIKIYEDIDCINGKTIHFKNGEKGTFDAIVAGIGYYRECAVLSSIDKDRLDDLKLPVNKQKHFGKDGLYFCGYWISPTGQFREISLDALKIAQDIAKAESIIGN
jgi:indole-3-pyruvate monooxygenase